MTLSPICIGFLFLILRSTLVFGFQRLSKTPWASRHRIDRTSIPLEQEQREHSRWFLGMVLDSTLLYFLLSLHVFQFSSQHGFIFIGFLLWNLSIMAITACFTAIGIYTNTTISFIIYRLLFSPSPRIHLHF